MNGPAERTNRKICVMGFSGSGKSTLTRALGKRYSLPVLHLDTVHFLPGWVERGAEKESALVAEFMKNHPEGWVIDGNYSKLCYEERLRDSDEILLLHFNRFSCLWRAYKRYRKYRGHSRYSMTAGCPEVMDRAFVGWILYRGRTVKQKRFTRDLLRRYGEKVTVIRTQRALDRLYRERGLDEYREDEFLD